MMGLICIYQQHNIVNKKCRFNPSMPASKPCTDLQLFNDATLGAHALKPLIPEQ
jgi:hypothetical protein